MALLRPTAGQTEFNSVPGLAAGWSEYLNYLLESNIYGVAGDDWLGAVEELKLWGRSDSDLKFYNPLSMPEPSQTESKNVNWKALPTSFDEEFGDDRDALYARLDNPLPNEGRLQDEYCEWVVQRTSAGKIKRIIFTSEPAAYYEFLFHDYASVGSEKTRNLLLKLYKERCDGQTVKLADLTSPDGKQYNPWNKWNNAYAVHMQQENNSLGAQVNIAAVSSILRQDKSGQLITDSLKLIECGRYGAPSRQSDPAIGAAMNSFARENRFTTLEDPIGLYMTGLDTAGWKTPDNSNPQSFWTVKKGVAHDDPAKAMVVRAEYAVPPEKNFTVSDIKIGGAPIRFGGQVAAKVNVRIGVRVGPSGDVPPPRAIGCKGQKPVILSGFANGLVSGMGRR